MLMFTRRSLTCHVHPSLTFPNPTWWLRHDVSLGYSTMAHARDDDPVECIQQLPTSRWHRPTRRVGAESSQVMLLLRPQLHRMFPHVGHVPSNLRGKMLAKPAFGTRISGASKKCILWSKWSQLTCPASAIPRTDHGRASLWAADRHGSILVGAPVSDRTWDLVPSWNWEKEQSVTNRFSEY